jgi:lysine-N-methylase
VPALLDEFATLIERGDLIPALQDIQPNHAAQAMVFVTLWAGKELLPRSRSERALIATVANNLGGGENGEVDGDSLIAHYVSGLARLDAALEMVPYLLDHYVLNEMFGQFFPFASGTPYENYVQLVARFGLLRFVLAARCNSEIGSSSPDELAAAVQVYCRRYQHDNDFTARVNRSLQNSGLGTLGKLYGLIRT